MSMIDFHRKVEALIAKHGFMVLAVGPSEGEVGFHYSIGLYRLSLPEVLIFGLPYSTGHDLITNLAKRMRRDGKPPEDGEVLDKIAGVPLVWRSLPTDKTSDEFVLQAVNHAGHNVEVGQLVWPDRTGKLPWDPGCDSRVAAAQSMVVDFRPDVRH